MYINISVGRIRLSACGMHYIHRPTTYPTRVGRIWGDLQFDRAGLNVRQERRRSATSD